MTTTESRPVTLRMSLARRAGALDPEFLSCGGGSFAATALGLYANRCRPVEQQLGQRPRWRL